VLVSKTAFRRRVSNKLALLQALKEQGVWLIDASIAALYPKPSPSLNYHAPRISWDHYIESVIQAAPEAILCIGLGAGETLRNQLNGTGIPWSAVPSRMLGYRRRLTFGFLKRITRSCTTELY
jgi:hypothetical protein